jgi:methylglutaconyl-CoA hydratase
VVSSERLDERIDALAQALLGNGPQAVRAAKRLVRAPERGAIDAAALIEEMARRTAEQRASPEGKEGVAAFLEKRQPDWK